MIDVLMLVVLVTALASHHVIGTGALRPDLATFVLARLDERERLARQRILDGEQRQLVVATIAAHRRLIDLYRATPQRPQRDGYEIALRLIAEAYSSHRDYDDGWTIRLR